MKSLLLGIALSLGIFAEVPAIKPTLEVIDKKGTFVIKYDDKVVMICEHTAKNCKLLNQEQLKLSTGSTVIYPGSGITLKDNEWNGWNAVKEN